MHQSCGNLRISRAFTRPSQAAAMASCASASSPALKKPLVSIFDWDDTLCPTTWLHQRGLLVAHGLIDGAPSMDIETFEQKAAPSPLTPSDRQQLELLESHVLQLLQSAAQFGPVFIVTAASLPWVVASAEHFLPRLRRFLLDNQLQCENGSAERVQVVSARDWYHHQVGQGGTQLDWKCATFDALCRHLKVQDVFARLKVRTDLVSIGDARFEQQACVRVEHWAGDFVRSKTMKLVEQPTLDEMLQQLKMTCAVLERMCQYDYALHLCVERRGGSSFGTIVGESECALDTLQLVQIDQKTVLEEPVMKDDTARLQQLLAAADSLANKAQYAITASNQNEPPLAAVPGVRS